MMEIPSGKYCDEPYTKETVCAFFCDACRFPEDQAEEPVVIRQSIEEGIVTAYERCPACLSAYPNGAVITITPKTQFDIGFIPHEQNVDPKTGVTTYTDVELLEVSQIIKPK